MAKPRHTGKRDWVARMRQFFLESPLEDSAERFAIRWVRRGVQFIAAVVRGFNANRCSSRAAALCYTTLLALVPLLAVIFSVSKGFLKSSSADWTPRILHTIVAKVAPQLEYVPAAGESATGKGHVVVSNEAERAVVQNIQTFIGNIDAGKLGTVGTVLLVLVSVQLLTTIEQTFNDIWGVRAGRSLWRKVVYYWTSITLGPVVIFTALAVTGTAEFAHVLGKFNLVPGFERILLAWAPYVVLWIGFALLYALMPNTTVRFSAALAGGFVAGTLWQVNSQLSAMYFSRVLTYSKIYGGLGVLPVFLLGLYFSWLIILLGAQVSFAAQNIRSSLRPHRSADLDEDGRELLACCLVLRACREFLRDGEPPTTETLADELCVPAQAVNQLAYRLVEGRLLARVEEPAGGLQPAHAPETITIADVLHVVRTNPAGGGNQPSPRGSEFLKERLAELSQLVHAAPANANFADLAAQASSPSSH